MWNHTPTDSKTRRPATALFLLCLCIAAAIGTCLLFPDSALYYYCRVFSPSAGFGSSAILFFLAFVAALIQWLLLRNEILEVAVWLPTVFSALGILAGEITNAFGGWIDTLWLVSLGTPLYTGSAFILIIAYLLPFRQE